MEIPMLHRFEVLNKTQPECLTNMNTALPCKHCYNITYHVAKGQHKSFALWLAVHSICSHLLLQLVQVKHIIQAVVIIADHIKNNMAIIFKGIDLMVDSHRIRVEFDPNFLLCLSVNKVNQGLMNISDERRD